MRLIITHAIFTGSLRYTSPNLQLIPLKNKILKSNEPQDLKVRPIVRGPKCPTRKLSELIDALFKPFLKHVKSYIRDSTGFLNKCDRYTDGSTVFATFDVVGLYTNIPHIFGIEAVK